MPSIRRIASRDIPKCAQIYAANYGPSANVRRVAEPPFSKGETILSRLKRAGARSEAKRVALR